MWKMCGKLSGSCDQNRKPQGKISQKGLYFLFLLSGNVPASGNPGKETPSAVGKIRELSYKVTGKAKREVLYLKPDKI